MWIRNFHGRLTHVISCAACVFPRRSLMDCYYSTLSPRTRCESRDCVRNTWAVENPLDSFLAAAHLGGRRLSTAAATGCTLTQCHYCGHVVKYTIFSSKIWFHVPPGVVVRKQSTPLHWHRARSYTIQFSLTRKTKNIHRQFVVFGRGPRSAHSPCHVGANTVSPLRV